LNRLGMAYFRPLVMAILKKIDVLADRVGIIKEIERFVFVIFRLTQSRSNYSSSEFSNVVRAIDRGDGVLVIDVKGDMTAGLHGNPLLVAPQDARSLVWDIARDCRTKQDARELASRLIPDSHDPMWSEAAREIADVLQQLCLEQWGAPYDLYHRPCSRFAAEFVGHESAQERVERLDPSLEHHQSHLMDAYCAADRCAEGIAAVKRAYAREPRLLFNRVQLASAYHLEGNDDAYLEELRKLCKQYKKQRNKLTKEQEKKFTALAESLGRAIRLADSDRLWIANAEETLVIG